MINVFYYYYYLFYTKILPDDQPHATVIFTLSFSLSLFVNGLIDIILTYSTNYTMGNWEMISIFVAIMIVNYLLFIRTGKSKQIVNEQPKFFNNHKLSIALTIIFFIITTSFLFLVPIYVRDILTTR